MVELSAVEARVVGALIEKEITTPEYYPLSLNATVNACNQKSSREPVMELTEAEVRTALFELSQMGLVRTDASARVSKFEHRLRDVLNLRRDEVAVICLLLLRGPQTAAELRARTERLYSFDDNMAVIATLERLAARAVAGEAGPLTVLLQRQPGAREARWAHLLSGPVSETVLAAPAGREAEREQANAGLEQRVAALEEQLRAVDQRLNRLENVPEA